tara:strand:- start:318 stop:656 length:339 start_codon:yes stop_codon:yes gene_type:complete
MALTRGSLSPVVQVSAGVTVGIITVASSKKVYIKSIMAHASTASSCTGQVYVCPTGITSGPLNRVFNVDVNVGETVLIEPSYPIVLDTTGDQLVVGAGTSTCNWLITGDVES